MTVSLFKIYARHARAHFLDACSHPFSYASYLMRRSRRDDIERWSEDANLSDSWNDRTVLMARYIRSGDSVAEFGAGIQAMRKLLPDGCRYQPYDLVERFPGTELCNLNIAFPSISANYDVAVFSGVIEYLKDIEGLFRWLRFHFNRVIFSYATTDHVISPIVRYNNGWINAYSEREILRIVSGSGFRVTSVDRWRNHVIFLAEAVP